jgi:hypothetical protein
MEKWKNGKAAASEWWTAARRELCFCLDLDLLSLINNQRRDRAWRPSMISDQPQSQFGGGKKES